MERYKKFISVWHSTRTIEEVAAQTGMDRRGVSNLAAQLRRNGVPLPPKHSYGYRRRGEVIDWQELKVWSETCRAKAEMDRYRQTG